MSIFAPHAAETSTATKSFTINLIDNLLFYYNFLSGSLLLILLTFLNWCGNIGLLLGD